MNVVELGHVVFYVRDLERSRHFYRDVLGFPEISGATPIGFPAAAFSTGRTHHELLLIEVGPDAAALPPGRRVGMYHIGLKIGDEDQALRDALATLRDHGVPIAGLSADPDGNEIELYVDVPGVDWRTDPSLVMRPTAPLRL
jgi:catechol 2,3-dioxygenase-like lactoylglutathione lyase family enzyme